MPPPEPEITSTALPGNSLQLMDDDITAGWDFNDLIWQDTLTLDPPEGWLNEQQPGGSEASMSIADQSFRPLGGLNSGMTASLDFANGHYTGNSHQFQSDTASPASLVGGGSHALVEHFLASDVPPILASVEIGPRWTSTKMLFASLAGSSSMSARSTKYSAAIYAWFFIHETKGLRLDQMDELFGFVKPGNDYSANALDGEMESSGEELKGQGTSRVESV